MTTIVSMLRAVNVGGHAGIKMDTLRNVYNSLGLRDAQTYVQSGNVVFRTAECGLAPLARRIEDAIERKAGFRADVILRTATELRDVIRRNPFARRRQIDPRKLLVTFLATNPDAETRNAIRKIKADPEELRMDGRELYIYFPNGQGRSKLPPVLTRMLKIPGTGRNWNTVTKLLEIAERLEASPID